MRSRAFSAGLLVFSLMWGAAPHAFAVTDEERAAARAAAGQGADAFDAAKWQEAVDLFSRAETLVHSPIHLLFIGRAQLKLGRWVQAYEAFNRIKREGVPAGAPLAVKKAVEEGSAELAQLEPQLPYVAVSVKNPSGEVEVRMDGTVVPPALLGLMRPVDPGQHQFQASNGQASSEVVTAEIKPATRQTVELELGAASAPIPAVAATPEPSFAPPPPASDESGTKSGLRIGSYAAFGVGAAGLAVGTVFLLKHLGTKDDADKICPTRSCPVEKQSEQKAKDSDAASQGTLAVIGYAVGGAGIAAGVTLLILSSGSNESADHQPGIRPYIGYQTAGVVGRF
jgi:hypothetical protein